MDTTSKSRQNGRFAHFPFISSAVVVAVSSLAIVGWPLHLRVFTSVVPAWPTVKPITAVCLLLLGLSLWFLRQPSGAELESDSERKLVSLGLAAVACGIALLTLSEYATGFDFGFDAILFRDSVLATNDVHPGRMAAATAMCVVSMSLSLMCMRRKSRFSRWAEYFALLPAVMGLIAVTGYIYAVPESHWLSEYSSMAIHSAALFVILGVGAIFADPSGALVTELSSRRLGGQVARRMLPIVILLPLALGWLRLQGQHLGYYGTEFGVALYAMTQVVSLSTVVILSARWLNGIDEKRVEAQEQSLRSISVVDNSDDAIITKTLDGVITSWNAGAQKIFGYSSKEVLGKPMLILFPQERVQEERTILERIARGETTSHFESTRLRKGGERIFVSVTISPLRNSHGRIIGASTIARDITQQKQNEQKVRHQEARLSGVINSAMDAVIAMDNMQRVTLFNPAAEKMFGYEAAEIVGQSLDVLLPERYRVTHSDHVRSFGEAGAATRRMGAARAITGLRRNGEEFPIEASISHVEVESERIFTVILRDITERERAAEASRQQRSLLDLAPLIVRSMDDRIEVWTMGAEELYGYTKREAIGRNPSTVLQTQFPQPIAEIREYLLDKGIWEGELMQRTRDGNKLVVASRWVLYRDSEGTPSRILEVNADITELKRAQTLQIQSQKLESLGTLAGGIAHDFNNILSAINGNAALALSETATDDTAHQHIEEISKAGMRATHLVKQILSFSRPSEQRREVQPLQDVVEEALKLVRATIPASIKIVTKFEPNLPLTSVDSTQIHQVIVNLATNAVHAIGDKPGHIELKLDAPLLRADDITGSLKLKPGRYVRLFVGDDGCGMDQATLARIFDPFFTTKPTGRGTGLGLSVVHGILTSYNGAVTVYSEPGRGTALHLYFPAADGEAAMPALKEEPINRDRHERVLYVDDEAALVTLGTRKLEKLGYRVSGFTDPVGALEAFRAAPSYFDILITDLSMPQMSGLDLAREMREERPDLPIVVTSGYVRPEDEAKAQKLAIYNFIAKPISLDELTVTLDRIFLIRGETVASATN
ncbi:MAG TPA: PAS domain S-box protein [Candidatus Acidoferrales bacterium]|nr:PAS domain S-box protein [Candidatus Acidoferrales bacterium]